MATAIIWSKDGCPFCTKAKRLLTDKNITIEERNISSSDWTREQLLESIPTAKTVPQIILYGTYIGGYEELITYFENHNMFTGDTTF